jgi:tetratricopeptide (TPR) repeat protein
MNTWRLSRVTILLLVIVVFFQPVHADTTFEIAISLAQKGDISYSQGLYTDALAFYNGSIGQDPYNSVVWNKFGITQGKLGDYAGAVDSFNNALKIDPYFGDAWVNKGDALTSLGKTGEAIDAYNRAIAINPNDLRALADKGINLVAMGKQDDAQIVFNEVIRLSDKEIRTHPNDAKFDAGLWTYRALAFTKLGRYREALQAYDQALSVDPKYAVALNNKQALLFTLDSMGNVSLPQPVPTTPGTTVRPTKKATPIATYIPVLSVIVLVLGGLYCRRKNY